MEKIEDAAPAALLGKQLLGSDFKLTFFPVDEDNRRGLLGYTTGIDAHLVVSAYLQGVFPWYNEDEGEPVLWWSPDPRFVLPVEELHVPHSISRFLKHTPYTYTMDTDFAAVINACAAIKRDGQPGTWIGPEIIRVYCELNEQGITHSVEVWHDGKLAGGLYGVLLGRVFCGESMFTVEDNSSKSAFVLFARAFIECGGRLIDSQVYTDNIARYGAHNVSRTAFLRMEHEFMLLPLSGDLKQAFQKQLFC
jgi:leucyl/phenylalanyl-tRNA---protein transferase